MSDTKTHLGIPGHEGRGYGLDLWGRVPRAAALPHLVQHAERLERQAAAIRAALAAGTVEVSYWRGHKRLQPPPDPCLNIHPDHPTVLCDQDPGHLGDHQGGGMANHLCHFTWPSTGPVTTVKRRADAILPGDVIAACPQTGGQEVCVAAVEPISPLHIRLHWDVAPEAVLRWYTAADHEEFDILTGEPERTPCAACGDPDPDGPVISAGQTWCSDCLTAAAPEATP